MDDATKEAIAEMNAGYKSIRAWEGSIAIGIGNWNLNVALSPLVWRKWVLAIGDECWSQGSTFHLFVGPLHIWTRHGGLYDLSIGFTVERNGFWWDKPIKKPRSVNEAEK